MPADDLNELDLAHPLPGDDAPPKEEEETTNEEEETAAPEDPTTPPVADKEETPVPPGVQKRLDKMTFNWREEQRKREAAERQLADLTQKVGTLENRSDKNLAESFKQEYNVTRAALTKAVEDGDTEAQVAHTEKLADMRARAVRFSERRAEQAQQAPAPQPQGSPAEQQAPPLAVAWYQNNSWFNAPGNEVKTHMARAIDAQLETEGFDMNTAEYYANLDSRLQTWEQNAYNQPRNPGPAPVAPAQKQAPVTAKGGRPRLTRDQLAVAQELGLTSEEELKAYADEIHQG